MIKKILLTLAGLLALLGGLAALWWANMAPLMKQEAQVMPPTVVSVAEVKGEQWESAHAAVGTVQSVQGVTVTAEVSGIITKISFDSGRAVQKGDVLAEQDVSVERALLKSAQAQAELARINYKRTKALREQNTVSQSELDTADAQLKAAEAEVENVSAMIEKRMIRAPFSGQLGIRQVNLGQYIEPGAAIVSLHSLNPVYVDFSLPQKRLSHLKEGMAVKVASDAAPGRMFEGKLTAIAPEIDAKSRSIMVRVTLENGDHALRPGMFVNSQAINSDREEVLTVPATAVLYAAYGNSVFVVDDVEDETTGETSRQLRQVFVKLGRTQGDFIAVLSGVKAGERVVSAGVFKLREKMPVAIDNTLAPKPEKDPHPSNS